MTLAKYPAVYDEQQTMDLVCAGTSIARYGDGEFNLCMGRSIPCQQYSPRLDARLRAILQDSGDCLVGIPNLSTDSPKAGYWLPYATSALPYLRDRWYGSAFITRPDSAPWIHTETYWQQVQSLWLDQDVTLVRGSERSLTKADLTGAKSVTEIVAPPLDAWGSYETLMEQIGSPARALLCLGPTATVMAVDLCARGVHAIDLGHVGIWLRRPGVPVLAALQEARRAG